MRKWLLFLSIFFYACSLSNSYIVPPYVVDKKIDVSLLKTRWQDYLVYYSGPIYNPSAICFIIKDKFSKIQLHRKWKQIKDKKNFDEIFNRLEYLEPHLYVIIPENQLLGYLYTTEPTFLKKISKDRYYLLYVSEQFNNIYYGGDGQFDFSSKP